MKCNNIFRDIEIDEIKTTLARLSAENLEISRRNAALESFCSANQNGAPDHSPVMAHRQSPYQNYNELQSASNEHLESNSNSQEKLQLNYTLVALSQVIKVNKYRYCLPVHGSGVKICSHLFLTYYVEYTSVGFSIGNITSLKTSLCYTVLCSYREQNLPPKMPKCSL